MKNWDAIVVGGGLIGISLARELRKREMRVLVVERGEPGHEASRAAAGMLAAADPHTPAALRTLAEHSARLYPEFVREVEDESGQRVDFRRDGTILLSSADIAPPGAPLGEERWRKLEPGLALPPEARACFLQEDSVDPKALIGASLKAARHRGVEIASGAAVTEVVVEGGRTARVKTARTHFAASLVINCAGAWAGQVLPLGLPTRPVKGQILEMAAPHGVLRHVVRQEGVVYLVPRSDGRILLGSTLEDAGFDKRTDADTLHRLQHAATSLLPALGGARILDAWAGLRPGTPDDLPVLGASPVPGYFFATGHFMNGILLAPATARVMAQLLSGASPEVDLGPFSFARFSL
ncbi:MAG TPA: FAD-dependent oxidoreductase [Terriglobales bacterium]|nr:FAD-dependent oxidoreductase [Terriglobales bacterium]